MPKASLLPLLRPPWRYNPNSRLLVLACRTGATGETALLAAYSTEGGIAKGVAIDLKSLDKRSFERSIEQELARIKSRPIEPSVVENAKSALESELKYIAGLREIATAEEASELDLQLEGLRAQLAKIDAELAARAGEEKVGQGSNLRSETVGMESGATTVQYEATDFVLLFKQSLEKRKQSGESKTAVLEAWLKEHRGLSRTQVTDYLAGRTKGRVSTSKCKAIEAAILASATKLGLATRTNSD